MRRPLLPPQLLTASAGLLGADVASVEPMPGGDLSAPCRLRLSDGRSAIAKTGPRVRTEAAMLAALGAAGAPVPAVLGSTATLLLLEDLAPAGPPAGAAWRQLGTVLRQLHRSTAEPYGWPEDYAFGPVPIRNISSAAGWPGFWAENRLLSLSETLDPALARRLDSLARALPGLLPASPPASLLHGDLWGGNILTRGDRVVGLIDPAACHGHAEADLAMLCLFDTPAPAFWDAYGQPAQGWETRRAVYQLWPALVHLRLFGGGYRGMVEGLLARLGH